LIETVIPKGHDAESRLAWNLQVPPQASAVDTQATLQGIRSKSP
jgi:hypothetical protein